MLTQYGAPGRWTEISCGICGANVQRRRGVNYYYSGIIGLFNHMRITHRDEAGPKKLTDTMRTCTRRFVSNQDVALLKKGEDPKHEIRMHVRIPPCEGRSVLHQNAFDADSDVDFTTSQAPFGPVVEHGGPEAEQSRPKKRLTGYDEFRETEEMSAAEAERSCKRRKSAHAALTSIIPRSEMEDR